MSTKKALKRQLEGAHQAIENLLARLLEYADDLDRADADIDAVIETAGEETRNLSKALRQSEAGLTKANLQVDRLLELSGELKAIAAQALKERDEVLKGAVSDALGHKDLIDGKTITEWHAAAGRLEYLNEFNRKRANKYEAQARYWELFADLCDTEKMTAEEITAKEGRLKYLKERMQAEEKAYEA